MQGGCEVLDMRYRVTVQDSGIVQCPVVTAGMPVTTLRQYHVQEGGPVARGGVDDAEL